MNRIINASTMFGLSVTLAFAAVFFVQMPTSAFALGDSGDGCCGGDYGGGDYGGGGWDFYTPPPPTPPPPAPTCTLSATPTSVSYNGNVVLQWSTSYATSVSITGFGSVALSGSQTDYNLTANKSYTLTAQGSGGTVTCQTGVTVSPAPQCPAHTTGTYPNCVPIQCPSGYTGTYPHCYPPVQHCPAGYTGTYPHCYPPVQHCPAGYTGTYPHCYPPVQYPSCNMYVSQSYVTPGQPVTLSWSAQNASYGYINNNVGSVSNSGSRIVYPYQGATYTGTFTGYNGQQITCSATVNMNIVYQNPTPYVTLSAVPYTGFDLGPLGTSLYWAFLVAWCLLAAYLVAIKRVHIGIYRWYNEMLFGSTQLTTSGPVVVSNSKVSPAAVKPVTHDTIDPFVLSQINRAHN